MNQIISIDKIFEMYGRVSFERDMLMREIQQFKIAQKEEKEIKGNKNEEYSN